jgi:hypothetical protein
MLKHGWVDGGLCLIALIGMGMVLYSRIKKSPDGKAPKGIGVRSIQMVSVVVTVPVIAILALEGALSGEGAGTILGAIVGFSLGGIKEPVPRRPKTAGPN